MLKTVKKSLVKNNDVDLQLYKDMADTLSKMRFHEKTMSLRLNANILLSNQLYNKRKIQHNKILKRLRQRLGINESNTIIKHLGVEF